MMRGSSSSRGRSGDDCARDRGGGAGEVVRRAALGHSAPDRGPPAPAGGAAQGPRAAEGGADPDDGAVLGLVGLLRVV